MDENELDNDHDLKSVAKSICQSMNSMTIANGNRNNLNNPSTERRKTDVSDILRELLMIERTFAKELQLTTSWIQDFFESDLSVNFSGESLLRFLSFLESLSDVHDNYLADLEECITSWAREMRAEDSVLTFVQFKSLTNPILSCLQVDFRFIYLLIFC
jgi:hypothetical protein